MAFTDYFEYEKRIGTENLIPWLKSRSAWPAARVLDVGCGYGGTLAAFKSDTPGCETTGLDRDPRMIREGVAKMGPSVHLAEADFFEWKSTGLLDLILMRDVLEHIRRPEQALQRAAGMLKPGGRIYASFAPFYGPFGGHQQNGSGPFAFCPWIQFLPEGIFRKLLPVKGNAYKVREELLGDMDSVLETRLTLGRFRTAVRNCGLEITAMDIYLSRPDYLIKFGWPSCRIPDLGPLSEIFATGAEALLEHA